MWGLTFSKKVRLGMGLWTLLVRGYKCLCSLLNKLRLRVETLWTFMVRGYRCLCSQLNKPRLRAKTTQNRATPTQTYYRYDKLRSEKTNEQSARQTKIDTDEPEQDPEDTYIFQSQVRYQLQRTQEASKQMLYSVYGNVISILEEYEARTHPDTQLPRSNIGLPDQSTKTIEDVKTIVQGQLVAFQMQSKACPARVRHEMNKDLRKKTLIWAAVREEKNLPLNDTDTLICQLYEVLVSGKTHHDILDKPRQPISINTIRETISHIFKGKHDAAALDVQFKNNSCKKASSPKTRTAFTDYSFELGASRLKRGKPMLSKDLDEDLEELRMNGPDDLT